MSITAAVGGVLNSVYLDNHTATRPLSFAVDRMLSCFKEEWGAAWAPHQVGQTALASLQRSLKQIYESLGAQEEDGCILSANGAEAIKEVLFSTYVDVVRQTGRNHILSTVVEEAPIHLSIKRLEQLGCASKRLPVNAQGQLTREILEEALGSRIALVSLSWANGMTGVIHPLADLVQACKEKRVRVHVDATYVIGKLFFRFQDLDVDYLTFGGHCLHGPQGCGGLLIKGTAPVDPLEGISWNAPAAAALAASLSRMGERFDYLCTETARLRDKLEQGIQEGFPDAAVFFQSAERLPNCCAIGFPGVSSEALLYALNRKGIYASMGGGRCQTLSKQLQACGVDPMRAECALSFALSAETSEEEIDRAIEEIVSSAHKMRKLSVGLV